MTYLDVVASGTLMRSEETDRHSSRGPLAEHALRELDPLVRRVLANAVSPIVRTC
jgi:hypothetical protein